MGNLQLSLKKKWFEMTKSGIKTEDYRDVTPYWFNRLMYFDLEYLDDSYSESDLNDVIRRLNLNNLSVIEEYNLKFKVFRNNIMTLGYPKKGDPERTLIYKNAGISIGYGNPEWGAESGKLYFIIKHGERL